MASYLCPSLYVQKLRVNMVIFCFFFAYFDIFFIIFHSGRREQAMHFSKCGSEYSLLKEYKHYDIIGVPKSTPQM